MTLTFDEATHTYRIGDRVLPSVTEILGAVLPCWQADSWYLTRGQAVHHGCRLLVEGQLDWSSVAPEIEPRIRAMEKFRRDYPAKVVACEQRMAHPLLQYAGTCDLVLEDDAYVMCDLKSSIVPQVVLQLALYSMLWAVNGGKITRAVAVELGEGTYKTLWVSNSELRRAEQTAKALLTVFFFMRDHKLLKGERNGN